MLCRSSYPGDLVPSPERLLLRVAETVLGLKGSRPPTQGIIAELVRSRTHSRQTVLEALSHWPASVGCDAEWGCRTVGTVVTDFQARSSPNAFGEISALV